MLLEPGVAVGAFVFSNHDDRDVGLARYCSSGADAFELRLGIRLSDFVFVPRRPTLVSRRDFADFRIEHLDTVTCPLANPIEDADLISRYWVAAIPAEVHVSGVGPDHRNRFQFLLIEREEIFLILEQYDGLLRDLQSRLLMLGVIRSFLCVVGIDVRILEQAETKLRFQHALYGSIQLGLCYFAVAHLVQQSGVNRAI